MILRELYFYLLQSEQGDYLHSLQSKEGNIAKIARATEILAQQFAESLNMAELAQCVGMSVAGFYAHFKNVTTMTPLQYQKSLQLNITREKLQSGLSVSETAYQIGYESPSQFSREYKRQFGKIRVQEGNKRSDLCKILQIANKIPLVVLYFVQFLREKLL